MAKQPPEHGTLSATAIQQYCTFCLNFELFVRLSRYILTSELVDVADFPSPPFPLIHFGPLSLSLKESMVKQSTWGLPCSGTGV